jgi:AcrR family transcriptional regulator
MATKRLTRAESKAQTAERILRSAEKAFRAQGYAAASIDDIAEDAGYSKGAVYANFPNKAMLFLAVSADLLRADARELFESVRAAESPAGIVTALHQWSTGERTRDPARFLMNSEFWIAMARDPSMRSIGAAALAVSREQTAALIEAEAARHGIRMAMDPMTIATVAIALRQGLGIQAWFDDEAVPPGAFADVLALLLGIESGMEPRAR